MVGLNGLEPSTSRLSGARSNQLSYRPRKNYILLYERQSLSKLNRTEWENTKIKLTWFSVFKPFSLERR